MATQATPASSILSSANYVMASGVKILTATSEANNYPKENLRNPQRNIKWRSTSASANQQIVYDLGTSRLPTVIGIIESNLDTNGNNQIIIDSCDSTAFSGGNLRTYTYTLRTPAMYMNVIPLYLSSPDSGSGIANRYWRITFDYTSVVSNATYIECGCVWMGVYFEIGIRQGVGLSLEDKSDISESLNKTNFNDKIRTNHGAGCESILLPLATALDIKESLDLSGNSKHVFVDLYPHLSNATQKRNGVYYGRAERISITHDNGQYASLSFDARSTA